MSCVPHALPAAVAVTALLRTAPDQPGQFGAEAESPASHDADWLLTTRDGTVGDISPGFRMDASQNVVVTCTYTCSSDCHADSVPIGIDEGVQGIVHLTQTRSFVSSGGGALVDPPSNCAYQTTNVDCSGTMDHHDVTQVTNVASCGASKKTRFLCIEPMTTRASTAVTPTS